MEDGFYRIRVKGKPSVGELRTDEDGTQWLYLIGYDEPVDPKEFEIIHPVYVGK